MADPKGEHWLWRHGKEGDIRPTDVSIDEVALSPNYYLCTGLDVLIS